MHLGYLSGDTDDARQPHVQEVDRKEGFLFGVVLVEAQARHAVKEGGAHAVHTAAVQLAGNVKKHDLSERGEAVQGDRRRFDEF